MEPQELAAQLLAAHPGRPGIELFRIVVRARYWHKEWLGMTPIMSIREFGRALGLADEVSDHERDTIINLVESARRSELVGRSTMATGRVYRWVVQVGDSNVIKEL